MSYNKFLLGKIIFWELLKEFSNRVAWSFTGTLDKILLFGMSIIICFSSQCFLTFRLWSISIIRLAKYIMDLHRHPITRPEDLGNLEHLIIVIYVKHVKMAYVLKDDKNNHLTIHHHKYHHHHLARSQVLLLKLM